MILTLDSSWATFDDYLGAMNSKFRTKAKQVLKKSSPIQVLDLNTTEDKERSLSDVDHLYNTLLDRANFSFGRLNAKTLFGLKETLQENFRKGGFLRIYPSKNSNIYDTFFQQAGQKSAQVPS